MNCAERVSPAGRGRLRPMHKVGGQRERFVKDGSLKIIYRNIEADGDRPVWRRVSVDVGMRSLVGEVDVLADD